MFKRFIAFCKKYFLKALSFITNQFSKKSDFTNQEKYNMVMYLLKGQSPTIGHGFALRHVDSENTKNNNVKNGFNGDAISYAITKHIVSEALHVPIETFGWSLLNTGEMSILIDNKPLIILDEDLALKIFDCLHEKILSFITGNFSGPSRHFMLIKNMNGACSPYDIDTYITGKCGKQSVKASQIVKVISKNSRFRTEETLLKEIETGILQLAEPRHQYSLESTRAILYILQEIQFNALEDKLTINNVRQRLIEAEYDTSWSQDKYQYIYDKEGPLSTFTKYLPEINEDLCYFQALM